MRRKTDLIPLKTCPDDLYKLVQDALDAVAEDKRCMKRLIDYMSTQLKNVIELGGN